MIVLLRLKGLTTRQHQDILLTTDEDGQLYPDVKYVASSREKDGHNVDLKIEAERDAQDDGYTQRVKVTREPVDKLWDILGIFPREMKLPQEMVELVQMTIHNAASMIGTLVENEVGREDLRKKLLKYVDQIYQAEKKFSAAIEKL